MQEDHVKHLLAEIGRITAALERLAGPAPAVNDWNAADVFVWVPARLQVQPVKRPNRIDIDLIRGVDHVRDILVDNTVRFARGLPANNVLLWGARGMGKSSLVKAAHASVNRMEGVPGAKLIEIHREDIETLPELMALLREAPHRIIL